MKSVMKMQKEVLSSNTHDQGFLNKKKKNGDWPLDDLRG